MRVIFELLLLLYYYTCLSQFLGAFAEFLKATFSFVMYVCPFVRPSLSIEQLNSHWK